MLLIMDKQNTDICGYDKQIIQKSSGRNYYCIPYWLQYFSGIIKIITVLYGNTKIIWPVRNPFF